MGISRYRFNSLCIKSEAMATFGGSDGASLLLLRCICNQAGIAALAGNHTILTNTSGMEIPWGALWRLSGWE